MSLENLNKAQKLYDQLMGDESISDERFDLISNKLINLVIEETYNIAEQVNSLADDDRIAWLLDQGWTVQDIKDELGKA